MNSFAAMARAIDFEVNRQVAILSGTGGAGGAVVQETRLWEEAGQRTVSMRTKEGLADYRYFPEPDLPTVHLTQSLLDGMLRSMPELPAQVRCARCMLQRSDNLAFLMQSLPGPPTLCWPWAFAAGTQPVPVAACSAEQLIARAGHAGAC